MILLMLTQMVLAGVSLDRVELLSDDPGTWLNHELPLAHQRVATTAVRLVEQIQPTWTTPWDNVLIGTSIASQSVSYEHALGEGPWRWQAGVQTRLLLPGGAVGTFAWRHGAFQAGLGVTALSTATWRRPDWTHWNVMPTASLAWVRRPKAAMVTGLENSP